MTGPAIDESTFVEEFGAIGATGIAKKHGVSISGVFKRRRRIEERLGRQLTPPANLNQTPDPVFPGRLHIEIETGTILIGSDAHYWPGIVSTAHRAFVRAAREFSPKAIIMNGDVLDGASVSRHSPIGWESRPSLIQEIEACRERLDEICQAAPLARKLWTLGNHDARFETRLATVAPEYARIHGVHLKDHFPAWEPAWSIFVNFDQAGGVVVKHRWKGGIHASFNNAKESGLTMVTGHLHSLKSVPFTNYRGTTYGVDCGTLAAVGGAQFQHYLEDAPVNWRSGFVLLTFKEGRLLPPELIEVTDEQRGVVVFRGQEWEV